MSPRLVGAIGSAAVHAAVLLALLPTKALPPPPSAQPIRSDEGDSDIRLLAVERAGAGLACANRYRGIGAATSFSGYVREVVAGGPADLAGLRVGDRFMNETLYFRDQYPLGKVLPLRIERDGRLMELSVTVGSICYEKGSP